MNFIAPPKSAGTYESHDLLGWKEPLQKPPFWFWLGIAILLVSQFLLFPQIEPFYTHFTLIMWWGYIFTLDGLIKYRRGESFLADRFGFFVFMAIASVFWWLIFEFYNCYLENWVYINLPGNMIHRYICYVLSFATITPALLLTYELFLTLWPPKETFTSEQKPSRRLLYACFIFGALCVIVPLILPIREARHYLFGFVWIGFIFLLEPLSYWGGGYSLLRLWYAGKRSLIAWVFASGAICGVLWEFWNYWAGAKWLYTVPITQNVRYFEMPLLGFLGFLPFAWECLIMIQFSLLLIGRGSMNPFSSPPSSQIVVFSRFLFSGLLVLFIATYDIHENAYFAFQEFHWEHEYSPYSKETIEKQEQKVMSFLSHIEADPLAWDPKQRVEFINALPAISPPIWSRISALQNHPDRRVRTLVDGLLRDYARQARFGWNPIQE